MTLMYGTVSVLFVIFVLKAHHTSEDKEIPRWLAVLTEKFLMRVIFWKRGCCCSKCRCGRAKHSVDTVHGDIVVVEGKDGEKQKPKFFNDQDYGCEEVDKLTWGTITEVLDSFFFLLVMGLVLFTTVIIFSLLLNHYVTDAQ